ncbi:MAG: endonuclease III [Clostridia bacterium]|nr:endonuclease III [Clostridia bacterium]
MTQAQKKENMAAIIRVLEGVYPEAPCALEWGGEPWKLLIMGRLSAQCTDARVNLVCRELFSAYPTPQAIAEAPVEELEEYIRPCGLYHVKSQNTKDACKLLLEEYGGVLPDTMEELLRFPGVGRKVANLLLGDIFGKGGVVTDTHCIRICGRLGMYPETQKTPIKVERILEKLIPRDQQSAFCHRMVQFGRDTCTARAPRCSECPLASLCAHALRAEKKRTR